VIEIMIIIFAVFMVVAITKDLIDRM